jgi:phospholipase C
MVTMTLRWRSLLVASAALVPGLVFFAACSSSSSNDTASSDGGVDGTGGDAGADVLMPPPITRTETEAQLSTQREACSFEAGAWPAQTIGTDYPVGSDIPINHVIVLMQENRSFDHYLGRLVAQGYYNAGDFSDAGAASADGGDAGTDGGPGSGFSHSDQLDGPPPGWSNPDSDGGLVVPHPDNEYCYGVNHSWGAMHDDYDNGLLDHFVTQNNPDGQRTFFYEDDTVIPFYYALASTFSVGDRYFCSVLSSTWPNRYFMMAATSFGIGDNSFCTIDTPTNPVNQIFAELERAGRTWKDYTDGPHQEEFFSTFGLSADARQHYGSMSCDLLNDINAGTLPDVSYVMGSEVGETSDEGPSALPGIGGELVEGLLRALFASPSWKDTAVFFMYDENGGLADHVHPAPACAPDGYAPHDGNGNALDGAFDTTGYRVPFIVISPYARQHFVSHVVHDHTSVVRFIESRFGLPAMTARDANSAPPMEMFDFKNPPFMTPPTITATTTVPPAILTECGQSLTLPGCSQ